MEVQVRGLDERLRLIRDGRCKTRMRVPEHDDTDARQEVEIRASIGVVQPGAIAADENHQLPLVGLQHVTRFEGLHLFGRNHVVIRVPENGVPSSARRPSNAPSAFASRPSTIATAFTPPLTAAWQAVSFATMPALAVPDFTRARMSRAARVGIVCPCSSSTPAVPPATTRRVA